MQELSWKTICGYFPKRNRNSHKGTFGPLLCITGSNRMPGACALSTLAALRSGAGLLKVATTERNLPILASQIYEAVNLPMQTTETGEICWEKNAVVLQPALKQASAVLIGCGLGSTAATQELLRNVVNLVECPLIMDADGLNALASCIDIMQKQNQIGFCHRIPEKWHGYPEQLPPQCRQIVHNVQRSFASSFPARWF